PTPPSSTPFPYTTLFRSDHSGRPRDTKKGRRDAPGLSPAASGAGEPLQICGFGLRGPVGRPDDPGLARAERGRARGEKLQVDLQDRKSTRLNSSHVKSSY